MSIWSCRWRSNSRSRAEGGDGTGSLLLSRTSVPPDFVHDNFRASTARRRDERLQYIVRCGAGVGALAAQTASAPSNFAYVHAHIHTHVGAMHSHAHERAHPYSHRIMYILMHIQLYTFTNTLITTTSPCQSTAISAPPPKASQISPPCS